MRLSLTVPDPDAAIERLRAAGFTVKWANLCVDPDGNRIMLSQNASGDQADTVHIEYAPPTTVAELRRILDQLPPEMPVLVDGPEVAYSPIASIQLTEVQELTHVPSYLGRFEHPADAAWMLGESDSLLPQRMGDPVVALVLRREEREDD